MTGNFEEQSQSQSHYLISGTEYNPEPFKGTFPPSDLPCSHLLPWEKQENDEESREKVRNERKEEMSNSSSSASQVLNSIYDKVEGTYDHGKQILRGQVKDAQKVRFESKLNLKDENMIYEYTCEIYNEKQPIGGFLYVTKSGLYFHSTMKTETLCVYIPWTQIESIKKEKIFDEKSWISSETIIQAIKDTYNYLNSFTSQKENYELDSDSNSDSLFIFTKDKKIHCFYKITAFHDPIQDFTLHAWNVIDHFWRNSWEEGVKGLFQQ